MTALDFLIEKQSFVSDEWLFFISRKRKRFLERVAAVFSESSLREGPDHVLSLIHI